MQHGYVYLFIVLMRFTLKKKNKINNEILTACKSMFFHSNFAYYYIALFGIYYRHRPSGTFTNIFFVLPTTGRVIDLVVQSSFQIQLQPSHCAAIENRSDTSTKYSVAQVNSLAPLANLEKKMLFYQLQI
jgi:Uma2 family endonuclease